MGPNAEAEHEYEISYLSLVKTVAMVLASDLRRCHWKAGLSLLATSVSKSHVRGKCSSSGSADSRTALPTLGDKRSNNSSWH